MVPTYRNDGSRRSGTVAPLRRNTQQLIEILMEVQNDKNI